MPKYNLYINNNMDCFIEVRQTNDIIFRGNILECDAWLRLINHKDITVLKK